MDSATINSQSSDDSHHPIVPYISLCSGYEGIGLGLGRCIKGLRAVAYCEREAFAISNLVAKMENGLLDAAPVFTDVSTFPWKQFAPFMAGGILSFGWPCQPVSTAGKRKATEDERWLFDIIADGIATLRPGMLFAENVEGLLSAKMPDGSSVFGHCIQRLERLHYRVAAGIFSASECGAPHQRKRVFILAIASGLGGPAGISGPFTRHEGQSGEPDDSGYKVMADAERDGRRASTGDAGTMGTAQCSQEVSKSQPRTTASSAHSGCDSHAWPSRPGEQQYGWEPPRVVLAHSSDNGCASGEAGRDVCGEQSDTRRQEESSSVEQSAGSDSFASLSGEELGDTGCERQEERQLPADWSEQSDSRQTQPALGGDANGPAGGMDYAELCVSCDNRTDELRLLGNGVVPATAERAFRVLIKELL